MIIIKPRAGRTRIRSSHNTFAKIIVEDCGPNDLIQGDEIWKAPADGNQVRKGDKWLHVTRVNGVAEDGWMAITHKGDLISDFVSETPDEPPVESPNDEEYILHVKGNVQRKFILE